MRRTRRLLRLALALSLLAATAAVLVPAMTGRPLVSYASSGSMEPTIGIFDAFLVDPWPERITIGDIIVYDSVTRGGPAVHRVIGGDENGWYTQGDANAAPDQSGGEPLVTKERILGKVVTRSDGRPILLDDVGITFIEARADVTRLGQAVGGPRQLLALAFLAAAVAFAIPAFLTRAAPRPRPPLHPRLRALQRRLFPRGILGRHLGLALLVLVVSSVVWAGLQARTDLDLQMVVVADPSAADAERAAAPGGELTRDVRVGSLGVLPTLVVVEGASPRALPPEAPVRVGPMDTAVVGVQQRAGETVGLQHDRVHVWRYPALLPDDATLALHEAAPGSPYAALGALLVTIGGAWFAALRVSRLPAERVLGLRTRWD